MHSLKSLIVSLYDTIELYILLVSKISKCENFLYFGIIKWKRFNHWSNEIIFSEFFRCWSYIAHPRVHFKQILKIIYKSEYCFHAIIEGQYIKVTLFCLALLV
ncbi:unnamed protein product [Blepharisma stoltei]|uniref:Maturase K n=1 Tax=Blepharisma stoltei TaxID=1481888 RepID=A0AAU9IAW0_9CILI|nr:unnamed protein product [Blepharisma stoltei]